jgi:hypothetical protein
MATHAAAVSHQPARAKSSAKPFSLAIGLLWVQGSYFFVTGVWPLVSIRTFKMVTGEKTDNLPTGLDADHWLVFVAGVLITSIGFGILTAAWHRRASAEIVVVAVGSAIGLGAIDVIYVSRGVIAPIYLLDAAIEAVLLMAWLVAAVCDGGNSRIQSQQ